MMVSVDHLDDQDKDTWDYWLNRVDNTGSEHYGRVVLREGITIAEVENRRWNVVQRRNRILNEVYQPAFQQIVEVKEAHVDTGDDWWLYTVSDSSYGSGISTEYNVEKPREPKNLKVGQRYRKAELLLSEYNRRVTKFNAALDVLLSSFLRENKPEWPGKVLRLSVNERFYWYHSGSNRWGAIMWKKLSWPEEEIIKKVIS